MNWRWATRFDGLEADGRSCPEWVTTRRPEAIQVTGSCRDGHRAPAGQLLSVNQPNLIAHSRRPIDCPTDTQAPYGVPVLQAQSGHLAQGLPASH